MLGSLGGHVYRTERAVAAVPEYGTIAIGVDTQGVEAAAGAAIGVAATAAAGTGKGLAIGLAVGVSVGVGVADNVAEGGGLAVAIVGTGEGASVSATPADAGGVGGGSVAKSPSVRPEAQLVEMTAVVNRTNAQS